MTKLTFASHPYLMGFEQLDRLVERTAKSGTDGYPPYNIEQRSQTTYRITLAVAGFSEGDLAITLEKNQLMVRGRQAEEPEGRVFLHRGIAARQFQRSFVLAEGVEVSGAQLENGLLHIDLQPAASSTKESLSAGMLRQDEQSGGRYTDEVLTGSGLVVSPVPPEAAMARLDAMSESVDIERWAGAVARPGELAVKLDVARSTIDSWRQQDLVIALPRGRRAHVYPLEQFLDRRPIGGLARVVQAAHGNHTVAWRWLRTPHVDFEGATPLTALRNGEIGAVASAADRSLA